MDSENLKYAKRSWSKDNLRLKETVKVAYGDDKHLHLVIMKGTNRTVAFNCFNPELIEIILKAKKDEKLKVWFTVESRQYKEKWYTNALIKWIEIPRLEAEKKIKQQKEEVLPPTLPPNTTFFY